MPGAIRPNKKAMKIAYNILKTPKDMQQKNDSNPSDKRKLRWCKESMGV